MWYFVVFQPSKCKKTHFQPQIWSIWPIFPNDSESLPKICYIKRKNSEILSKRRNSESAEGSADHLFVRKNMKYTQRIVFTKVHDVEFCHSLEQVVKHTLPALALLKAQGKVRWVSLKQKLLLPDMPSSGGDPAGDWAGNLFLDTLASFWSIIFESQSVSDVLEISSNNAWYCFILARQCLKLSPTSTTMSIQSTMSTLSTLSRLLSICFNFVKIESPSAFVVSFFHMFLRGPKRLQQSAQICWSHRLQSGNTTTPHRSCSSGQHWHGFH